MWKTYCGLHIW